MERVHTLRIIFGHPNVNDALLRCFFDRDRRKRTPIRRLWLEDSRLSAGCDLEVPNHPLGLPAHLSFEGLQSIRLRRMPMRPGRPVGDPQPGDRFNHARGEPGRDYQYGNLHDGAGYSYATSTNLPAWETLVVSSSTVVPPQEQPQMTLEQ